MSDPKQATEEFDQEDGFGEQPETQAEIPELEGDLALLAEIDALKAERDAAHDKFMRALAEAENTRKRAERDRRESEAYGGARIARDLMGVYDNLSRAVGSADAASRDAAGAVIEGVELTLKELLKVFEKNGLELITPQIGDQFNPDEHEAMFEAPVPNTVAGEIIQITAAGARLNGRLLRPAQVGVSSLRPS